MPYFAQSSIVPQPSKDVFERFLTVPAVVSMTSEGSTLSYWVEGELQAGSMVQYRLQAGLQQYSWSAILQPFSSPSKLLVILCEGLENSLTHFNAYHFVEDFKNRTLIRDEFEFTTNDADLEALLNDKVVVSHALEHRGTAASNETQSIELIGQELA